MQHDMLQVAKRIKTMQDVAVVDVIAEKDSKSRDMDTRLGLFWVVTLLYSLVFLYVLGAEPDDAAWVEQINEATDQTTFIGTFEGLTKTCTSSTNCQTSAFDLDIQAVPDSCQTAAEATAGFLILDLLFVCFVTLVYAVSFYYDNLLTKKLNVLLPATSAAAFLAITISLGSFGRCHGDIDGSNYGAAFWISLSMFFPIFASLSYFVN